MAARLYLLEVLLLPGTGVLRQDWLRFQSRGALALAACSFLPVFWLDQLCFCRWLLLRSLRISGWALLRGGCWRGGLRHLSARCRQALIHLPPALHAVFAGASWLGSVGVLRLLLASWLALLGAGLGGLGGRVLPFGELGRGRAVVRRRLLLDMTKESAAFLAQATRAPGRAAFLEGSLLPWEVGGVLLLSGELRPGEAARGKQRRHRVRVLGKVFLGSLVLFSVVPGGWRTGTVVRCPPPVLLHPMEVGGAGERPGVPGTGRVPVMPASPGLALPRRLVPVVLGAGSVGSGLPRTGLPGSGRVPPPAALVGEHLAGTSHREEALGRSAALGCGGRGVGERVPQDGRHHRLGDSFLCGRREQREVRREPLGDDDVAPGAAHLPAPPPGSWPARSMAGPPRGARHGARGSSEAFPRLPPVEAPLPGAARRKAAPPGRLQPLLIPLRLHFHWEWRPRFVSAGQMCQC